MSEPPVQSGPSGEPGTRHPSASGSPKSGEEVDTSRRARTKEREKASKAQPTSSRVTNGPPEGAKVTPPTQIDLASHPAQEQHPTQGEGRADPKGPGDGQEEGKQRACDQKNPLKVR